MLISAEGITHRYGDGPPVISGATLEVDAGETAGLLGPSGSGKTTLGMIVAGLLKPTSGTILYNGTPEKIPYRGTARRKFQILFQHPETSFNPRLTILQSLREIFRLYKLPFSEEILLGMLEEFGIYGEHLGRYPAQLSGGELQRIALARVLLPEPDLIVLDEPTSMLDVISQAQIMLMLKELQAKRQISYLLITHDEQLCGFMSGRVYRINEGTILKEEPN